MRYAGSNTYREVVGRRQKPRQRAEDRKVVFDFTPEF
jgi:hypothetical protein